MIASGAAVIYVTFITSKILISGKWFLLGGLDPCRVMGVVKYASLFLSVFLNKFARMSVLKLLLCNTILCFDAVHNLLLLL